MTALRVCVDRCRLFKNTRERWSFGSVVCSRAVQKAQVSSDQFSLRFSLTVLSGGGYNYDSLRFDVIILPFDGRVVSNPSWNHPDSTAPNREGFWFNKAVKTVEKERGLIFRRRPVGGMSRSGSVMRRDLVQLRTQTKFGIWSNIFVNLHSSSHNCVFMDLDVWYK